MIWSSPISLWCFFINLFLLNWSDCWLLNTSVWITVLVCVQMSATSSVSQFSFHTFLPTLVLLGEIYNHFQFCLLLNPQILKLFWWDCTEFITIREQLFNPGTQYAWSFTQIFFLTLIFLNKSLCFSCFVSLNTLSL